MLRYAFSITPLVLTLLLATASPVTAGHGGGGHGGGGHGGYGYGGYGRYGYGGYGYGGYGYGFGYGYGYGGYGYGGYGYGGYGYGGYGYGANGYGSYYAASGASLTLATTVPGSPPAAPSAVATTARSRYADYYTARTEGSVEQRATAARRAGYVDYDAGNRDVAAAPATEKKAVTVARKGTK